MYVALNIACYKQLEWKKHCNGVVLIYWIIRKDWMTVFCGCSPSWVNHVKSPRYLFFLHLLCLYLHIIVNSYLVWICLNPNIMKPPLLSICFMKNMQNNEYSQTCFVSIETNSQEKIYHLWDGNDWDKQGL